MPDTDEDDRLQPRRAEFLGNFLEKFRDIVAQPARAERSEVGEVFAKLRGLHARRLRERLARNGADAVLVQPRETAQINRKAINRLARDFRASVLFQRGKIKRPADVWQEASNFLLAKPPLFSDAIARYVHRHLHRHRHAVPKWRG